MSPFCLFCCNKQRIPELTLWYLLKQNGDSYVELRLSRRLAALTGPEPRSARFHFDYDRRRNTITTGYYVPPGDPQTEFAVAERVSFGGRFRGVITDFRKRRFISRISQWELPAQWFEIAIGSVEPTPQQEQAMSLWGIQVSEGRILTAPTGFVAHGDSILQMHRLPKAPDRVGEQRTFVSLNQETVPKNV